MMRMRGGREGGRSDHHMGGGGISHIDTPLNGKRRGDDVLMFCAAVATQSSLQMCVYVQLRDYQHMYTWFPAAAMNFSLF